MEDKLLVKDLFKKSIYGVVGYVANIQDIDTIERYILFNKEVLLNFPLILVATNYGDTSLKYEYHSRWTKYFNNVGNTYTSTLRTVDVHRLCKNEI